MSEGLVQILGSKDLIGEQIHGLDLLNIARYQFDTLSEQNFGIRMLWFGTCALFFVYRTIWCVHSM